MREIRKQICFHGRVQGVGFRYRAKYLASFLGLTGWVKNEWDGTVTMQVQGIENKIQELIQDLQKGSFIHIEWMDIEEIAIEEENNFRIR